MAKLLTCPDCGKKFYLQDSIDAYYEETGGEGNYDIDFAGEPVCPECAVESAMDRLSDQDAELIYLFSGCDEDYDFR
jgi:hypothetical protein